MKADSRQKSRKTKSKIKEKKEKERKRNKNEKKTSYEVQEDLEALEEFLRRTWSKKRREQDAEESEDRIDD